MSGAEHTPGPVEPYVTMGTQCDCGGIIAATTNTYHDAKCPVSVLRRAAPDLLAACRALLPGAEAAVGKGDIGVGAVLMLRAAIAKAEGGQP